MGGIIKCKMKDDNEQRQNILFEDIIQVNTLDNSKFEQVARIQGRSQVYEATIHLDIKEDLFPVAVEDSFKLQLVESLGSSAEGHYLFDDADYIMYGVVFKVDDKQQSRFIYMSFGGLLLCLQNDVRALSALEL